MVLCAACAAVFTQTAIRICQLSAGGGKVRCIYSCAIHKYVNYSILLFVGTAVFILFFSFIFSYFSFANQIESHRFHVVPTTVSAELVTY